MPIENTKILAFSEHNGGRRARVRYTFASGQTVDRLIMNAGADLPAARLRARTLVEGIETRARTRDAAEAVALGLRKAHGEATEAQVLYAWLLTAYEQRDPLVAWEAINDLAPGMLALGYTNEQYAAAFGTTVEEVENIKLFWGFLETNQDVIVAYGALVDPREDFQ